MVPQGPSPQFLEAQCKLVHIYFRQVTKDDPDEEISAGPTTRCQTISDVHKPMQSGVAHVASFSSPPRRGPQSEALNLFTFKKSIHPSHLFRCRLLDVSSHFLAYNDILICATHRPTAQGSRVSRVSPAPAPSQAGSRKPRFNRWRSDLVYAYADHIDETMAVATDNLIESLHEWGFYEFSVSMLFFLISTVRHTLYPRTGRFLTLTPQAPVYFHRDLLADRFPTLLTSPPRTS